MANPKDSMKRNTLGHISSQRPHAIHSSSRISGTLPVIDSSRLEKFKVENLFSMWSRRPRLLFASTAEGGGATIFISRGAQY
jgi:hypothetical protein